MGERCRVFKIGDDDVSDVEVQSTPVVKVVGYLDRDKYLLCVGCVRPEERDEPIHEDKQPYCDETCDRCGKPLASTDLSVHGYWFNTECNGRQDGAWQILRRGKVVADMAGLYPGDIGDALKVLEDLVGEVEDDEGP